MELGGKDQEGTMVTVHSGFLKETVLPFLRRHSTGEVLCRNVWMSSHEYKDVGFWALMLLWATQVLLCPDYLIVGSHFCAL